MTQIVSELLRRGLIPILAHVERYSYFREDTALLKQLIDLGALGQGTMQALFDRRDKNFTAACMQHGLIQILASDAHNTANRKPCMELLHQIPKELQQLHEMFSTAVWENEQPPYLCPTNVEKIFFGYR